MMIRRRDEFYSRAVDVQALRALLAPRRLRWYARVWRWLFDAPRR